MAGRSGGNALNAEDRFLVQILWDFAKRQDNDLGLTAGDVVRVLRIVDDDWYLGESTEGERGFFPSTYGVALTPAQPVYRRGGYITAG